MADIVKKELPESYWQEISKELASLVRHLSEQPRKVWEQSLATGKSLLDTCRELNLTKLSSLLSQVIDYAFDAIKNILQGALTAIEDIAAAVARTVTENLWPWLREVAGDFIAQLTKAGVREVATKAVEAISDYIRENWHHWADAAASAF